MIRYITHTFSAFIQGFTRNPFRSIGIVSLLSVLFFVMFLLLMFQSLTKESVEIAQKKVDLVFFLEEDAPTSKISLLQEKLKQMEEKNVIESYKYISADESLKIFEKKYPERFSFWKRSNLKNPLSPAFEVVPKNDNTDIISDTFASDSFSGILDIQRMQQTIDTRERSQKVLHFLQFIEQGIFLIIGVILLSIAGVTAAFISSSFILRQKEIFIMRLVGASHRFIRTPFLAEGILLTSISVLLGWLTFFQFRTYALGKMFSIFESPAEAASTVERVNIIWAEFISQLPQTIFLIATISLFVSFFSIERFLRKKNILN